MRASENAIKIPPTLAIQENAVAQLQVKAYIAQHVIHPYCVQTATGVHTSAPLCYSDYKVLGVAYQRQQESYWCGPASTVEILAYLGIDESQANMASYEGTTKSGTYFGNVQGALNYFTPPGNYWLWLTPNVSNYSSDWWNDMYYSLFNRGKPAVDGIYMSTANNIYIDYNWEVLMKTYSQNSQVWHIIASDGLSDSTTVHQAHFVDSFDDGWPQYQTLGNWWTGQSQMIATSQAGAGLLWAQQ